MTGVELTARERGMASVLAWRAAFECGAGGFEKLTLDVAREAVESVRGDLRDGGRGVSWCDVLARVAVRVWDGSAYTRDAGPYGVCSWRDRGDWERFARFMALDVVREVLA